MKRLVHLGVVVTLCSISATVSAYNWKNIPGAACVPAESFAPLPDGTAGFFTNLQGHLWFNWDGTHPTGYHPFTCPILRDSLQGTTGLVQLGVNVADTTNLGEALCTATSTEFNGNLLVSNERGSGVTFSAGYKNVEISLAVSRDWGVYNLRCKLNRDVKSLSAGWVENDGQ